MFKTLDEVLAKRTQEDRTKIIAAGDKLAAKRDLAVEAATGGTKAAIPEVNLLAGLPEGRQQKILQQAAKINAQRAEARRVEQREEDKNKPAKGE